MNRPLLVLFVISALILAGCQVETQPQDAGQFSTNRAATRGAVEYSGNYTLYGDDDATKVGPVLMTAHLKTGETVGFNIDQNHVPYAIAGTRRLQLSAGRYRWETRPDPGQMDWNKTNVVVIEVVVGTAVVALIVLSTLLAVKSL